MVAKSASKLVLDASAVVRIIEVANALWRLQRAAAALVDHIGRDSPSDRKACQVIPDLTVVLRPNLTNGSKKVSYLLPQNLTCIAKSRITAATNSVISPAELQQLRQLVVLTIGGLN